MQESPGLLNLDIETLASCVRDFTPRELTAVALTCKQLKCAVFSDGVWQQQFRKRWPGKEALWHSAGRDYCSGREKYLRRHTALQQFAFSDPSLRSLASSSPSPIKAIIINDDSVDAYQLTTADVSHSIWDIERGVQQEFSDGHTAPISCMQALPATAFPRSAFKDSGNLLLTGSLDKLLRLWSKSKRLRTYKGHTGAVSAIAGRLIGGGSDTSAAPAIAASGGTDATVRIWVLLQARARSPLVATLAGHQGTIQGLAVAGHNSSLLTSVAFDDKLKVWDVSVSTPSSSSSCVGTAKVPKLTRALTQPLWCPDANATCYVAGGSGVVAVDVRSMSVVSTVAWHKDGDSVSAVAFSSERICTGGREGILWDVRRGSSTATAVRPLAELTGHANAVTHVHVDRYKAVTVGDPDRVRVWDSGTGEERNVLFLHGADDDDVSIKPRVSRVTALAVKGERMVVASMEDEVATMTCWDYSNCEKPLGTTPRPILSPGSKFWESQP